MLTGVTVSAVTIALVLGIILTHRFSARIDVTSARDQKLAPRTEQLLSQIDQPYRIVIAAEMESIDVRSRQRLNDVLKEVNRFNSKVMYRVIDTASVKGMSEYKALVGELVARDERLIRDQVAAVELGAAASNSLSTYLSETLAPALAQVQESIPPNDGAAGNNRQYFEQAAAAMRLLSRDLAAAAGRAGDSLKARIDDIPVPATDKGAGAIIDPMTSTVEQMTSLARELAKFVNGASAGPAGDLARPLLTEVEQRRDQAAVLMDSMRRLRRLDVLRIVDVLRTGSAALVIGPPEVGLSAIDVDALMPSTTWLEVSNRGTADLNRRVEELIATSMTSLLSPVRPIVVIVHGELRPFFDKVPLFTKVSERLQLRGVEVIEWAAMVDEAPPRLAALNPDGSRPVVYASISPDSSAASPGSGLPSGVDRARKLGEVLTRLGSEGKNLLVSINPSVLPTYGDADPATAVLARFGMAAESGRPILREKVTAQGRFIETDQTLQPIESPHLVSGAVRGLPTRFPWPISLVERPGDAQVRLEFTSLYSIPANTSTWVESQWLQLWQTPREQRSLLPDAPVFDDGRDLSLIHI